MKFVEILNSPPIVNFFRLHQIPRDKLQTKCFHFPPFSCPLVYVGKSIEFECQLHVTIYSTYTYQSPIEERGSRARDVRILLHRTALAAELVGRRQRLPIAFPFSRQQGVEKGIHAGVPIGQASQDPVDCDLGAHRYSPQHVGLVEGQQLPDPEGQEAGPEGYHNAQDEEQHLGLGRSGRVGRAAPAGPGGPRLRHPVQPAQSGVQRPDGQPRAQDAGAEEDAEIGLGALLVPGRHAELAVLAVAVLQVQSDHHGKAQRQRQAPGQAHAQQARGVGGGGAEGPRHGPVAVQTHGRQGEDGGVHCQEVQAEEQAAAQLPKGPAGRKAVVHDEGRGEEVEEVGQSQAQYLEVEGGGRADGRGDGRGRRGEGRGGSAGQAGRDRESVRAAAGSCSVPPPSSPASEEQSQGVQVPCDTQQGEERQEGAEESCGGQAWGRRDGWRGRRQGDVGDEGEGVGKGRGRHGAWKVHGWEMFKCIN